MAPFSPSLPVVITLVCWLFAAIYPFCREPRDRYVAPAGAVMMGAASCLWSAVSTFHNPAVRSLPLPFCLTGISASFRFDWLSAWFLGTLAVCTFACAWFTPSYMRQLKSAPDMRLFWASLTGLLLAMCGVITSANAITFLICWELMAVSSAMLVFTNHRERSTRSAGLIYIGATRISTLFVAGAFLWIHGITHSWQFASWHLSGTVATGPAILLVVGLVIKAGCWPFHLWLPAAHPAAPAPVSALMSGVMVKTALYALIRFFIVSGAIHSAVAGYVLLALGVITAFWGVLFTLLQRDLKRLLAYSTVENVGIITVAIGLSITASGHGETDAASVLLTAALFGVLSHALFKSVLFLSAGAVDETADCHDIDRLGGLGRRMPRTFLNTLVAAASFCSLPPFAGFATEWMLFHGSLLIAIHAVQPELRMGALLLLGWLSLVGALAMTTCIRFTGVIFLGRARSRAAEKAHECTRSMQAGMGTLSLLTVVVGLCAPQITAILASGMGRSSLLPAVWTLPTAELVLLMVTTTGLLLAWLQGRDHNQANRRVPAWDCGAGGLSVRMQTTAESFAQPIARMFGSIYRYAIDVQFDGTSPRLFPEQITVETHSEATLESRVYEPLVRTIGRLGELISRLQTGSIHSYLITMFATLLLLLGIAGHYR